MSFAAHLHGRDLARNGEVHELVPDLHGQASHQRRVDLRLEDDGLVRANLIDINTDVGVYGRSMRMSRHCCGTMWCITRDK